MGSGQTWAPLEIGRLLRLLTLKVTSASVHLRVAESEISFSAKIELSNAKTPTNHYPNRSVLNGHPTPLLPWCSSTGGMTHPSHLSVGSVLTLVSQELQSGRVHVLVLGAAEYMSYMGILSKKNQDLNNAPCESRGF